MLTANANGPKAETNFESQPERVFSIPPANTDFNAVVIGVITFASFPIIAENNITGLFMNETIDDPIFLTFHLNA